MGKDFVEEFVNIDTWVPMCYAINPPLPLRGIIFFTVGSEAQGPRIFYF